MAGRLEAANRELERLVTIDPLTELLNRRGLERVMTAAIEEATRKGSSTVLMLADCDDLKDVNNKYGQAFGDILLKEVAHRISGALRKSDFVCRMGGDEFFLVLPDIRPSEAAFVAERVRLDVSSSRVVFAAEAITTTVSIGVAKLPQDVCTIEEMLSLTRMALSRSKKRGKNVVSLSWADQPAPFVKELTTVLRAVTIGKGLRVKIQPILQLKDLKPVGQEFLIRGPAGPLQSPEVLFALGRDHNLLTAIDLRALRTSLEVAKELDPRFRIHLNLFPSTLLEIGESQLIKMLDIGKPICLELSEQQFIGWAGTLLDRIVALKKAGIQIAIDDVGGGFGALDSVILLEPDVLKIDKRIIDNISHDDRKVRLLQRMVRLAHVVNAQVIAEGVETKEDLAILKDLGIEFAQGFLWSRPVDISELKDDYSST